MLHNDEEKSQKIDQNYAVQFKRRTLTEVKIFDEYRAIIKGLRCNQTYKDTVNTLGKQFPSYAKVKN